MSWIISLVVVILSSVKGMLVFYTSGDMDTAVLYLILSWVAMNNLYLQEK